jgi:ParB family chromosome partitioning protein
MTEKDAGKRPALGKGFNSLLGLANADLTPGSASGESGLKGNSIVQLDVAAIEPNPHQPRKIFSDEALESLCESIKEDGVVQPIIVSKGPKDGSYILIAGERRWRASKMAGKTSIPALIKECSEEASLRIALIENIQRADLSIIEEAEAYQSLINDFGLSQEQCAKKVGKDRSTVTNALRLLTLPREIQDDLLDKKLTMGHGRALLSLEDKKAMLRARDIVVKKQLSVRQTEQLCKSFKLDVQKAGGETKTESSNADLDYLADAVRGHLRTKVKISGNGSRGKLEISYFSAAELERVINLIGVELT